MTARVSTDVDRLFKLKDEITALIRDEIPVEQQANYDAGEFPNICLEMISLITGLIAGESIEKTSRTHDTSFDGTLHAALTFIAQQLMIGIDLVPCQCSVCRAASENVEGMTKQ